MRFWIALFAAKLYVFFKDKFRKTKSDRAGLLAEKLCPHFLGYIAKLKNQSTKIIHHRLCKRKGK